MAFKINGVDIANISKINGIAKASISKINGVTITSTSLLLDLVSNCGFAYALRKLRAAYSGYCCTVRRGSDNAEYDIAFNGSGVLASDSVCYQSGVNQGALSSVFSGTNGFVKIWYDQSSNGINASNTTTGGQPTLISSGSILTNSLSKPGMLFDGSDDVLGCTHGTGNDFTATFSLYSVFQASGYGENGLGKIIHKGASSNGYPGWQTRASNTGVMIQIESTLYDSTSSSVTTGTADYFSAHYSETADTYAHYKNGSTNGSGSATVDLAADTNTMYIGNRADTARSFYGYISEVIGWTSLHDSTNRGNVDTNVKTFYGIS